MALIFANKAALRASLLSWMSDGDIPQDTLDRAIALTEAQMRRRLRIFHMEVTVDLTLSEETVTVPSRFLSATRLYIPGNLPMEYLTPELLIKHQVENPSAGIPSRYTLEGREDELPFFRVSPLPDTSYTLRLTYMADPALLGEDDCNAILDQYPDAYHYGSLTHLGDYVRNKQRLPEWRQVFEQTLEEIYQIDLKDKVDGSTLRPTSVYGGR